MSTATSMRSFHRSISLILAPVLHSVSERTRLASVESEPQPDEPTDRQPAIVEAVDAEPVDDVDHVLAETIERVVGVGRVAVAVPSNVEGDDAVRAGELAELVVPHVVVAAERVHEDDRRPVGVAEEVERDADAVARYDRLGHVMTSIDDSESRQASIAAPAVMKTSGTANHSACHEPRPRSSS